MQPVTIPPCGSSFLYNPGQSPEASIPKLDMESLNMELCPTVRLGLNPVRNPTTTAPSRVLLPKPRSLELALSISQALKSSRLIQAAFPPWTFMLIYMKMNPREELVKMFICKQSRLHLDSRASQKASECTCILAEVCYTQL